MAPRPGWLPSQVIATRDTSAAPTRLIAVDKTALPAGSTVDTATGAVNVPLGVAVTSIAGVTRNGGAFVNAGQFVLSGNNLIVTPSLIAQPAAGVTDSYVVAVNNAGGGTTLVTVVVTRGSVRIESVTVTAGVVASWNNIPSITEGDNGGKDFNRDFSVYCNNCTGGVFSAIGLPPGLTINQITGVVT